MIPPKKLNRRERRKEHFSHINRAELKQRNQLLGLGSRYLSKIRFPGYEEELKRAIYLLENLSLNYYQKRILELKLRGEKKIAFKLGLNPNEVEDILLEILNILASDKILNKNNPSD